MTAAPGAPVSDVRLEARSLVQRSSFALYVGIDEATGPAGSAQLAHLAQAIEGLVAEIAPDATVHSALAPTDSHQPHRTSHPGERATAGRPRSAAARAQAAWRLDGRSEAAVVVDCAAREVVRDGAVVPLTFKEFALLEYLLRSPWRAVSREELLGTVWHTAAPVSGTRTIDVHVRRLREKLGGCLQIVTVRGVGYRCDPTPDVVLVGSGDAG